MNTTCTHDGCTRSVANGDAIHRTSPKGGPFWGLCTEHFRAIGGEPDQVTLAIERAKAATPNGGQDR